MKDGDYKTMWQALLNLHGGYDNIADINKVMQSIKKHDASGWIEYGSMIKERETLLMMKGMENGFRKPNESKEI